MSDALKKQVGGQHYLNLKIQPVEYIDANNIPFIEGCAIKYLTRWRDKGGVDDLRKAIHFINIRIESEERKHDQLMQRAINAIRDEDVKAMKNAQRDLLAESEGGHCD